ncbi:hypothetical protein [Streptomyces sp. NBC_01264]|uniref:hypothetical protein n=1 Tax=Streptomyces sp. NBC_01264 TaxID=2903804 RepID=UPI0022529D21|nr:hypothetical protein [Streptomyces sp. NBC_01264]MCX4780061.1 hypothetical protein [Streptomyces sp. NBC_01264]
MSTYNLTAYARTLSPALRTDGTANGVAVDRAVNGGMQDAMVIVSTGTVTDGSHAITIQDSADGSTGWTAVAADQIQGSLPTVVAANDDTVYTFGVLASRRYLRVVATTSTATTGGILAAGILLGAPRFAPVN